MKFPAALRLEPLYAELQQSGGGHIKYDALTPNLLQGASPCFFDVTPYCSAWPSSTSPPSTVKTLFSASFFRQVTRGKSAVRSTVGLDAYRPHAGPISSAQRAPHRRPEPRGNQEYDEHAQTRKVLKPQPRLGDRHQAPISSAGSAAASSLMRDAQGSRGGGGRAGVEKNRDPSPDPLGALRSPRPAAASRKEAPAVKLEANGRLKTGYGGGKPSSRDNAGGKGGGGGGGDGAGGTTRIVRQYNTSADTRTSYASGNARSTSSTAGSDFYTSRFRRP